MGYYPSKIACILNIVIMLGYGMVDCVVGGQILSAVADGRMTVIVGIVIVALVTWFVVLFGMRIFHIYERYALTFALWIDKTNMLIDGPGSLSLLLRSCL